MANRIIECEGYLAVGKRLVVQVSIDSGTSRVINRFLTRADAEQLRNELTEILSDEQLQEG